MAQQIQMFDMLKSDSSLIWCRNEFDLWIIRLGFGPKTFKLDPKPAFTVIMLVAIQVQKLEH